MKKLIVFGFLLMQSFCFAQNLDSGLVGYWPFNGNVKDSSLNKFDGIIKGKVNFSQGKYNQSITLGGFDNPGWIEVNNDSKLSFIDNFSFTGWFRIEGNTSMDVWGYKTDYGYMVLLGKSGDRNGISLFIERTNSDKNWRLLLGNGRCCGSSKINCYTNCIIPLNEWHMFSICKGNNRIKLYLDCQKLIDTSSIGFNLNPQMANEPILIGINQDRKWYPFLGSIDEVKVFNRVLSENEICSLYNFNSKNSLHIDNYIENVGSENLHIALKTKLFKIITQTNNLSFNTKLKFNATTFLPTDITKGAILKDSIDNDFFRILSIQCDSVNISNSDSILTEIVGTVLLGDTSTKLEILDFKWNNANIEIDTIINGSLETKACALKLRRVQLFTPTTFSIQPNPSNSNEIEIRFEGDEEGLHTLNFYNVQGLKIDSKEWINAKNVKKKDFKYNLKDYSNGVYYVVLHSPWNVISKPLMIVK